MCLENNRVAFVRSTASVSRVRAILLEHLQTKSGSLLVGRTSLAQADTTWGDAREKLFAFAQDFLCVDDTADGRLGWVRRPHVLGSSATGMYACRIWRWGMPIVLTVDLQAKWNSDDGWIQENCYEVVFTEPCYCSLE